MVCVVSVRRSGVRREAEWEIRQRREKGRETERGAKEKGRERSKGRKRTS